MSFVFATRGLYNLLNLATTASTDLRCGILTSAGSPTNAQIRDTNFVSDLLGLGGGIAETSPQYRQDLGGVAVNENDAGDNVTFTATAPTINNVPGGQIWKHVFYYIEGASDAARAMVGVDTPSSTLAPNGGNVTLPAFSCTITDNSSGPFVFSTHGLYTLITTIISGSTDLRCGVLQALGTLTAAQIRDQDTVTNLLGLSGIVEASGTGYIAGPGRIDLSGVTLFEDDPNDKVTFTASAPTLTNVAAGQTWRNVFYYVAAATPADSTSQLIGVDTPATPLAPNGGNVTLPAFSATVTDTSP